MLIELDGTKEVIIPFEVGAASCLSCFKIWIFQYVGANDRDEEQFYE